MKEISTNLHGVYVIEHGFVKIDRGVFAKNDPKQRLLFKLRGVRILREQLRQASFGCDIWHAYPDDIWPEATMLGFLGSIVESYSLREMANVFEESTSFA